MCAMKQADDVKTREYLCIGLLAHVDAGKTTLSEAILHRSGEIRNAGRVDHRDSFLDTDVMERDRGITIFSKQASFVTWKRDSGEESEGRERVWTLVDTPGHADFSTEMERTLQVLDYAVLILSASDGVTGQVRTLWRLLTHYKVPVFFFVNKMDQPGVDRDKVFSRMRSEFGPSCVDLQKAVYSGEKAVSGGKKAISAREKAVSVGEKEVFRRENAISVRGKEVSCGEKAVSEMIFSAELQEEIAVCDDALMEKYLEGKEITVEDTAVLVSERKLFPVCFGSALKEEGVDDLLFLLDRFAPVPERGSDFAARVYKITHDQSGARLTWLKVTGGKLLPRQQIAESLDEKGLPEKASQLRYYRGQKFEALQEAPAGIIAAVTGLSKTCAGMGLGALADDPSKAQLLQPVMQSRLILPPEEDLVGAYKKLRLLEEEDPMLRLSYDEEKKEITVQLMGRVQREILQRLIADRFGMMVEFGPPRIVYRETISGPAEGVGHFEPLRHYAEVHLLLEPGEPGSGLVFESRCAVNDLALNWQRLILTHLEERRHRGVLTGAEITDMKISILGGRAHAKHTEGGDFRKATYRAVRQGLMMADSVLLEPYYEFRLEIPAENIGRAMSDLQQMGASFGQPVIGGAGEAGSNPQDGGSRAVISGTVPVAALGNYVEEVASYTRGAGSLSCMLRGYVPCRNADEVIAESGYDPELDVRNPSSSVFCAHGAGVIVPWNEVRSYMHVDTGWRFPEEAPVLTTEESMELAAERARKAARDREERKGQGVEGKKDAGDFKRRVEAVMAAEKELLEIFERTYGPIGKRGSGPSQGFGRESGRGSGRSGAGDVPEKTNRESMGDGKSGSKKPPAGQEHYLLVDGYNIIFAWESLRGLAVSDIKAARDKLMDILSNFAGFRPENVILVFDAYKVPGGRGSVMRWHNIDVVFTKEAETADLYIEKTAHILSKKSKVTVATSDAVEQVIIFGAGAYRMSARMLLEEILYTERDMRERYAIGTDE